MEIERKWLVDGWPEAELPLLEEHSMRQGYLVVEPTVRIREEILRPADGEERTAYILCLKSGRGLAREEIELALPRDTFLAIEKMIGLPLIPKLRRTYGLPDGLRLEVNHVDEGQPGAFWYAEVEYPDEALARSWDPASVGLKDYLCRDVTEVPGQTMGAFWERTRVRDTLPAAEF